MSEANEDAISDAIEESAVNGIKKVTGDTGSTEMHSIEDQIAADRYVSAKRAARRGLGVRLTKLIPPGQD